MIDTLKLHVKHGDFSVSDRHGLQIQPATLIQGETGNLESENEWRLFNKVVGAYAKYEGDKFHVNINANGMSVTYSVPRLVTGSNVYSVGHGGLSSTFQIILQSLNDIGIDTDIDLAGISRLDCFRNISTALPFIDYAPIFNLAHAKRQQRKEYGTTYLWHNKQQELCVYDKRHELVETKKDIPIGMPDNITRIEQRWMRSGKVRSSLPVGKVADLKDRDRYNRIKLAYSDRVCSTLFRWKPESLNDITTADIEGVADMAESEPEIFENLFALLFAQAGGTEEKLREGLRRSFEKRYGNKDTVNTKISRAVRKYRKAREKVFFSESGNRDLYTELYEGFKKAV